MAEQRTAKSFRKVRFSRLENQDRADGPMVEDEAFMPNEYASDINDENFRKENIPSEAFHAIGRGNQAIVLYDMRELEQKEDGKLTFPAGFTFLLREILHTLFLSLTHSNVVEMNDCFCQNSDIRDRAKWRTALCLVGNRMNELFI